jgi:hypothetical protein
MDQCLLVIFAVPASFSQPVLFFATPAVAPQLVVQSADTDALSGSASVQADFDLRHLTLDRLSRRLRFSLVFLLSLQAGHLYGAEHVVCSYLSRVTPGPLC